MINKHLLETVTARSKNNVFYSKNISIDQNTRLIINNIKSEGYTYIELDAFYDNFDFYHLLKEEKNILQEKIKTLGQNSNEYKELRIRLNLLQNEEIELRVNILELALSLENMRDTKKLKEVKIAYREGRLSQVDKILPDDYLLEQYNRYKENEKEIENTAVLLVDNANEFRVKAETTMLNYEIANRFEKSVSYLNKGVRSAQVSLNKDFIATYQFMFGLFYFNRSNINKALPLFQESLILFDELAITEPDKYIEDQAEAINNIAVIHSRNNRFTKAIKYYDRTLDLLKNLPEQKKNTHYLIAMSIFNKGNIFLNCNDIENAIQNYKRSLQMWERLEKNDPEFYKPRIAKNYNSLGVAYKKCFNNTEAEKAYIRALEIKKELTKVNPQKYTLELSKTLTNLGGFYRIIGRNKEALKLYFQALEIQENLVKNEPVVLFSLSETYNNLGVFYFFAKNDKKAIWYYKKSIVIRNDLARENPLEYDPYLAKTHINLAISLARKNDIKEALVIFEKPLSIYMALAKKHPNAYLPMLENVHFNIALAHQKDDNIELAQEHFISCLAILESLYKNNPSVYVRRLIITLTKMSSFNLDFLIPPNIKEAKRLASKAKSLCTKEVREKYRLIEYYKTIMELMTKCK